MDKRTPLIAGNWKMFKTCREAVETAINLEELVRDSSGVDIMIAPTFTALFPVWDKIKGGKVALGGQNVFWEKEGAYTGEISCGMLASAGCEYVILGHSERRQFFNETDATVNKKIKTVIKAGLKPVMCIGETEKQREDNKTFSILDKQVKVGLEGFSSDDLDTLVIAYEPIWAIGTGKTATSDQAQEVHGFLRSLIKEEFGASLADSTRILYGGSVKPANIAELMAMPDIDGALVGGASLDAESFSKIVKFEI